MSRVQFELRLNRLTFYLNLLVGLALAAALGVMYWFAYRVLPKTSGELSAPLAARATVTRDKLGVPHIDAASLDDALFLQGYVIAQDRLWQMDSLRRYAAGELSEVAGKAALELDMEMRRLRMRRVAEDHYKTLPAQDRIHMAAFARGINHFIETHRGALPVEFSILGYDPRPWSVVDEILVGLFMYRDLTTSWKDELQKRAMLDGGDRDKVELLFPTRSGKEVQPGSNAWVLSGKHTATGKPILANDPHLEFSLPPRWYMVELQAPGLHVAGVAIPGLPGVIVGHNERISWGLTNLQYDVQDLYIEKINPQSGQYLFRGAVQQSRVERETILVKGEKPVEFVNSVTNHGPIWQADQKEVLSLRWIAAEPGIFQYPFLQLDQANNWQEFRAALSRFKGPGQNFVYADTDGNIGSQVTGQLPIRRTYNGDLPVDGSSGEFEWDGFIPFEQLPSSYNPPSGYIVLANQNPFPANWPYRLNGNFAPHYRSRQIRDLLTAKEGWKTEDMLTVQKDVYSGLLLFLARQAVAAYDAGNAKNTQLSDAAEILRNWNGQMEKGQAAPLIATLFYQHLRRAIAERASPGKGSVYEFNMAGPAMEKLLRERPDGWFANYNQVLLRAFLSAVEEGQRKQGRNLKNWDYGRYAEIGFRSPVGGQIPWVGKYFNVGPIPMSGSSTTVKQLTTRVGPSMRFVADTSNWSNSLMNLTLGESGQFLSSHYKDQWDAYYNGKSFPFQFGKQDGSVLSFTPAGR